MRETVAIPVLMPGFISFIHSGNQPAFQASALSGRLPPNYAVTGYAAIGNWSRRLCPHLVIGYAGYAVFGYTDYAVICYWLCWLYDNWLRR